MRSARPSAACRRASAGRGLHDRHRTDPIASIVAIEDVGKAIDQIAQTTLRAVVGRHTLDEALSEIETINQNIREILDVQTEEWGVEVTVVELKDIQLPDSTRPSSSRRP